MGVLYQSLDLALPWSSSRREDAKFNVIAAIFVVTMLVMLLILSSVTLPEVDRQKAEKIPDRVAKFLEKKKKEPKPKPKPKAKPKAKEKPKEIEKPKEKPKEVEKPKEKPKPKKVEPKREAAKKKAAKNISKVKDQLAGLRSAFKPTTVNKNLAKGGATATKVSRSQIMGKSTTTSGGIKTAAYADVGVGALAKGAATQVDSVSLGGGDVAAGSGVGDQIAAAEKASSKAGKKGQRSEQNIRSVLDQNKGALYNLYSRALRKDPTLMGKVLFEITIEADGSVSKCKIVSSELNNPKLERRLVSRMKKINFGAANVSSTKTRWAVDFFPS